MTGIFNRPTIRQASMEVLLLLAAAALAPAAADPLILQGSTTFNRRVMEPHQAAIETNSGQELTVIPNRTMLGIIALMEGRAHMAMISASLDSEVAKLKKVMPGLDYDRLKAFDLGVGDDVCALVGGDAGIGLDEVFARDDARGRNLNGLDSRDVWLAGPDGVTVDDPQALEAVLLAHFQQGHELADFGRGRGHHDLSDVAVRNVVGGTEFVGEPVAAHGELGFERTGGVIEARMDHSAVAGAGSHGQFGKRFEQKHIAPMR